MKGIKITAGVILLCFSAFYLLGVVLTMSEAKSDAFYSLSYLQVDSVESSRAGDQLVTEWGEKLPAKPGYTYYRLDCTITNLSSREYYNIPADRIYVEGVVYDQVNRDRIYEDRELNTDKLFYDSAQPVLPGKSTVVCPIYIQVKDGVGEVSLKYSPNYEEDDIVLTVPLAS